jgi:hypothetical protein
MYCLYRHYVCILCFNIKFKFYRMFLIHKVIHKVSRYLYFPPLLSSILRSRILSVHEQQRVSAAIEATGKNGYVFVWNLFLCA